MLNAILLVVVIPLILIVGIKGYLIWKDNQAWHPVVESEEKQRLADRYALQRFESAWSAIGKHETENADESTIPLTPGSVLLEDRLSGSRDAFRSEVEFLPGTLPDSVD